MHHVAGFRDVALGDVRKRRNARRFVLDAPAERAARHVENRTRNRFRKRAVRIREERRGRRRAMQRIETPRERSVVVSFREMFDARREDFARHARVNRREPPERVVIAHRSVRREPRIAQVIEPFFHAKWIELVLRIERTHAFEQRELLHAVSARARKIRRDGSAHRMTHEKKSFRRDDARQCVEIRDVIWKVIIAAGRDAIGFAEPAHVRCDHAHAFANEMLRDAVEARRSVHESVNEDTRRAPFTRDRFARCPLDDRELETISARAKSSHRRFAIL